MQPRIAGDGMIHSSHFDAIVETNRPIYAKEEGGPPDEISMKVGEIIAEKLVDNGATLQMGWLWQRITRKMMCFRNRWDPRCRSASSSESQGSWSSYGIPH